jgi:lipid-A-disaccharide synthase
MQNKKVFIAVGEASGEAHAARVIRELRQLDPDISVSGIGGDKLRDVGVEVVVDFSELAVMGLVEVLKRYREIKTIFNQVVELLKVQKPDLLIVVDYPGFNLKLAKEAKKLGIKVLYYISPKVWAWRKGRVKTIYKVVDHMAVLFPFEVPIYQQANVPVSCVGHPLVDAVKSQLTVAEAKVQFGLNENKQVLGLFPGSRRSEVQALLPLMIQAAERIVRQRPNIEVVLPLAPGLDSTLFDDLIAKAGVRIRVISGDFYELTQSCDAIVAASGTVTLEIALLAVPHFIIYKVSPLTYRILKRLVKIPYVGLCNIVTSKNIITELLQDDVTVDHIELELLDRLDRQESKLVAEDIRQQVLTALGPSGGAKNAALLIQGMVRDD